MADETLQHRMPPWLPDQGDYPIIGERRLTAAQIDTIQRWVKGAKSKATPPTSRRRPCFQGAGSSARPT